jgi:Raf kinase inhibitor-like YbhB/YbcL family protein
MRAAVLGVLGAVALALGGCGGGGGSSSGSGSKGFEFTSQGEISDGVTFPMRYTCDGEDAPPRLAWTGVPMEARELALVLEDPDAPGGTFTHWIMWGIAPGKTTLGDTTGLSQGRNDAGGTGYLGPCPPRGEAHHYLFRLLALDEVLHLRNGADRDSFDDAVSGHVIDEALMTATYGRQ